MHRVLYAVGQEEHHETLQGQQLATMRALLEQQVLPETAAVLATADKNAREIPSSGKERVVPKILVPLVKVRGEVPVPGWSLSKSQFTSPLQLSSSSSEEWGQ